MFPARKSHRCIAEKKHRALKGWRDGEGLVHATSVKGIKLKKKKRPRIKERETEDLREGRAPRNREETERSCATFKGIDRLSCIAARKEFVEYIKKK